VQAAPNADFGGTEELGKDLLLKLFPESGVLHKALPQVLIDANHDLTSVKAFSVACETAAELASNAPSSAAAAVASQAVQDAYDALPVEQYPLFEQRTAAWHALRARMVTTASQAFAMCMMGCRPFKGPNAMNLPRLNFPDHHRGIRASSARE
jgi:hypothetical protein